jgi:glycosyltransferase involved in cell wall biosynthesis
LSPKVFIYDSNKNPSLGGIGKVTSHILHSLAENRYNFLICSKRQYPVANKNSLRVPIQLKGARLLGTHLNRINLWFENIQARLFINHFSPDIILYTYSGNVNSSAKSVYLVYDLIFELFLERFNHPQYHNFVNERAIWVRKANLHLCISKKTQSDLINRYQVSPAKTQVTYLGVDESFFSNSQINRYGSSRPFFLYVGTRLGHKNFLTLLKAYCLGNLFKDFDLHLVSPIPVVWEENELELIRYYDIEKHISIHTQIPSSKLEGLYQNCSAYVYPSLYEGFGLPLLEAMASGALVIASNAGAMPEIGQDVPFYFEPLDTERLTSLLQEIPTLDSNFTTKKREAGKKLARLYPWSNFHEKIHQCLQSL